MKKDIQIFDSRPGDRAIGILCENDVIVNITFMQGGFDHHTISSVIDSLMKETNIHLLEIYDNHPRKPTHFSRWMNWDKII